MADVQCATAVCSQPKLFVGQLPDHVTAEDVQRVFSQYGPLRHCGILSGVVPSAMVRYDNWSEAEAALEGENGKTSLGGNRPLVVKFADPPKRDNGQGIAPKKVFVGQVPQEVTDEELQSLFASFGNVVDLHRFIKPGQPVGCAFVTFGRWAEAEAAIAALNGSFQYPTAKAKVVVKFADAKSDGSVHPGGKRQLGDIPAQGSSKKAFTGGLLGMGGDFGGYAHGGMGALQGFGLGMGMGGPLINPMLAMGMPNLGALNLNGVGLANMQALGMVNPAAAAALGSAVAAAAGTAPKGGSPWKLFVGQVPFEMDEGDLVSVFAPIGQLAEVALLRGQDGRSKGCAFVTYMTQAQAELAVQQLHGKALPGDPRAKPLVVKFADHKGEQQQQQQQLWHWPQYQQMGGPAGSVQQQQQWQQLQLQQLQQLQHQQHQHLHQHLQQQQQLQQQHQQHHHQQRRQQLQHQQQRQQQPLRQPLQPPPLQLLQ